MLKALGGPFPDVVFCPTGGITRANAAEFLAQPNVLCVGGSWLAPARARRRLQLGCYRRACRGRVLAARRLARHTSWRRFPPGVGPKYPQVVVLVGATGDLARRKLLPGLYHLTSAGFIPQCRIVGVSLEDLDPDGFRKHAREALDQSSLRKVKDADWATFAAGLDYVSLKAGPDALHSAVQKAQQELVGESRVLHYLSVPPSAALATVRADPRRAARREIARRDGEAIRHRSQERGRAQRAAARGVHGGADLSDRSFPRQGARAEHSRVPVR